MSQRVLHSEVRPTRASQNVSPAIGATAIAGIAGMLAGMMRAMFAMIVAAIADYRFWAPPRAITALFFGTDHQADGFDFGDVVGAWPFTWRSP